MKKPDGMGYFQSRTRFLKCLPYVPPTKVDLCSRNQSSSFIGPLVVGVISDLTGNIRYGFFFIIFMVWSAVPILMYVDVEQGRRDAQAYVYNSFSNNIVDNNVNGVP